MPAFLIPLAIAAASAAGGALSNRGQKNKSSQTGTESFDNTQSPTYDNESNFLRNTLIGRYLDMIQGDDGEFWDAYKMKGLNEFNAADDSTNNVIRQILGQRGLSLSPGGASTFANAAMQNQFAKGNFLSQVPLLQDQRRRETLGEASRFFSTIPYSVRRTGTGSSSGERVDTMPSNMLGGGFTGLGASLAYLYGRGAFGDGAKPALPGGTQNWMSNFQMRPQRPIGMGWQ